MASASASAAVQLSDPADLDFFGSGGFGGIFKLFVAVLGSGSGLKMLLEVIRCILAEYWPVISILDPFQANFAITFHA